MIWKHKYVFSKVMKGWALQFLGCVLRFILWNIKTKMDLASPLVLIAFLKTLFASKNEH